MPKITQELCGRVRSGVDMCLGSKMFFNKMTVIFLYSICRPCGQHVLIQVFYSLRLFCSSYPLTLGRRGFTKESAEQTGSSKRYVHFDFHSSSCVKTVLGSTCLLKKNTKAQCVCILDASWILMSRSQKYVSGKLKAVSQLLLIV